ncbi:MAG: hypothetical protein A2026_02785, partial [Deltaproteobacteria bacterium RBG_19FT_COMBO_46_12]
QVKKKACKGCEICLSWCPQSAISMVPSGSGTENKPSVAFIDSANCIGCGECILACPSSAIQIQ